MPYFQRKSYAEMIADAVRTPAAEIAPESVPQASLMERAAAILKEESTQLPKYSSNAALPFAPPEAIVMLQPKDAVRPGQTANLVISVTNDSDTAGLCTVWATDLVSVSGSVIGKGQLRISPRQASVAPGAAVDFSIAIDAPLGIAPGQYAGLLMVSGFETVHAVLTVRVTS
jgi:hypothetical protein